MEPPRLLEAGHRKSAVPCAFLFGLRIAGLGRKVWILKYFELQALNLMTHVFEGKGPPDKSFSPGLGSKTQGLSRAVTDIKYPKKMPQNPLLCVKAWVLSCSWKAHGFRYASGASDWVILQRLQCGVAFVHTSTHAALSCRTNQI